VGATAVLLIRPRLFDVLVDRFKIAHRAQPGALGFFQGRVGIRFVVKDAMGVPDGADAVRRGAVQQDGLWLGLFLVRCALFGLVT